VPSNDALLASTRDEAAEDAVGKVLAIRLQRFAVTASGSRSNTASSTTSASIARQVVRGRVAHGQSTMSSVLFGDVSEDDELPMR
jgi:hypothetical protein